MKKILSRIFSVMLIAALSMSLAFAQTAKKAKAQSNAKAVSSVTMKVDKKGAKTSLFDQQKTRKAGVKGLRNVKSGNVAPVKRNKVVAREGASFPEIYSVLIYSQEEDDDYGLYSLGNNGTKSLVSSEAQASSGAVCLDDVYYNINIEVFLGYLISCELQAIDVNTGELLESAPLNEDEVNVWYAKGLGYDPVSKGVYGIAYDEAGTKEVLYKYDFDMSNPTATRISDLDGAYAGMGIDATGQIYAIRYDGAGDTYTGSTLCKIDKTNGSVTEVGELGIVPQYTGGATIDTRTGKMYYNLNPTSGSFMYEIDLATAEATCLWEYANEEELVGFAINNSTAVAGTPEACEDVAVNFEGDALSGTVTCKAPTTLVGGGEGSGSLVVALMVNGEENASKEVEWGAEVSFDVTLEEAGLYSFDLIPSNEVGDGPKTSVKNVWVGADTPEATKATLVYENGNMEVTWSPVTGTVNGGYMDAANLTYTVKNWNDEVVAEGLTVTTFTEAVAAPAVITSYFYTVYAVYGNLTSAGARTNTVVLGEIVPPYEFDFEENGVQGWTILDENGDGKKWSVYEGNLRMAYNSSKDMDDWAITPAIKLEAGKAYEIAFQAWAQSNSYPEEIEVMIAKEPSVEAMNAGKILCQPTAVTKDDILDYSDLFSCTESGNYYIGFHGISQADMFYLCLGNISIGAAASAAVPGEPENLIATPASDGSLKCTISFNAPEVAFSGAPLQSLEKVEVLRDGELVKTFENPAPGESLTYEDTLEQNGSVTYTVIGYNEDGKGRPATVTVFVGFSAPNAPDVVTLSGTDVVGQALLTWSEVIDDINGLPLSPVTYNVYVYTATGTRELLASELTTTSYTYQAVEEGKQEFVQCLVFAVYNGEEGEGAVSNMEPLGTPYNGIFEDFADAGVKYEWAVSTNGMQASLFDNEYFADMAGVDGDGFIGFKASAVNGTGRLISGLISLEETVNPGMSFYTYNIAENDTDEVNVYVKAVGDAEWAKVYGKEICETGEVGAWNKIMISLDAYANKTIQVAIESVCHMYTYSFYDNIKVGAMLGHDLVAADIAAPAKVKAGSKFNVDVTVMNEGTQAAESYSVELYMDEELVQSKDCTELASSAKTVVSFECEMSAIATEPVKFYAKVVYAQDENVTNNQTGNAVVTPVVSTLPAPTGLEAADTEAGVKLTWNEPVLEGGTAEEVTEDFEDAEAFSAEYGNWTFVDVDDSAVGGFDGIDVPNITTGTTKGSFWIWDASQLGNATFAAHSGDKYLFALFRYDDGTTDDWAISPELTGDAQTISFYARSYSTSYPEKIAVYTSTGSLEPADFTLVEGTEVAKVPGEWTRYDVELPVGAKRFAIRSYATGSFMLMVDDVTYTPAGDAVALELAGYNVYRDGVKINDALVQDTEFVDANVVEGEEYTYVVTAVYTDKGESAASNEVSVLTSAVKNLADGQLGIYTAAKSIVVLNARGLDVTVASTNGAVVYSNKGEMKTTVSVAPGVYVVKAGKTVKKVIVK